MMMIIPFVLSVCTVKITRLTVPSQFILRPAKPDNLILDCEYEIEPHEKGLVLKWFLNNQPVYQWIPSRQPFGLTHFKNRVNTSYSVSPEQLHKHRAMAVTKPMWNFTGEYSCSVQTFQSNDKRAAKVIVIGKFYSLSFSLACASHDETKLVRSHVLTAFFDKN